MTAYHEHTHQKRAVINLTKASRLVDDKRTLVADPASPTKSGGKGRRKSAFAEEDEGYAYVAISLCETLEGSAETTTFSNAVRSHTKCTYTKPVTTVSEHPTRPLLL